MKVLAKAIQVKLSGNLLLDFSEEHNKVSCLVAGLPADAFREREEAQALNELDRLFGLLEHLQTYNLPLEGVLADIRQVVAELAGDVPFQSLARLREEDVWVWRHMCQTLASDPEEVAKVHAEAKDKYPDLDLKELGFQTNSI